MSNYIFGGISGAREDLSVFVDAICARSVLGFHDIRSDPSWFQEGSMATWGMPLPADCAMSFCISDGPKDHENFTATYLIFSSDWAPDYDYEAWLPYKLKDRLALIDKQVQIIFEETQCSRVDLWISEVDQLEGIKEVSQSGFLKQLEEDFDKVGIPCLLYRITKS